MLDYINVAGIYGSTSGYLLQIIYIRWCRENIQHSMSANRDFNNILMENYKRDIFPTFVW